MGANAELLKLMGPELELLLPVLDEKARRLALGAVARAAGDGGVTAVAKMTGASWQTVADGAAELGSGQVAPEGRIRRPGGGRKKLAGADPGLVPALLALVEDSARGDPESPLAWTTRSVKHLSDELTTAGHRCSPQTVWRLLHEQGFSTQANAKVTEGRRHPDRDAQFRYIAARAEEHLAAGQPVISVDAKKKEEVGEYAQAGREWRPKGAPVQVRDHSFAGEQGRHAIPYGVYDVAANTGFVNVGTDHNTAAFAVESIRRWWHLTGKDAYPGRGTAADLLRRRREQRMEQPGLEDGPGGPGAGDGPGDHLLPLPARHLQVEQDRAPAVLPDHPGLARPPADQPRRHHQHHRRGHHPHRAHGHRSAGRRPLPHGYPDQRRADARPPRPRVNTPRLPRRVELHPPARPAARPGTPAGTRAPAGRRRPRRRPVRPGQPGADRPVPPRSRRPGRQPRTALRPPPASSASTWNAATPAGPGPARPPPSGTPWKPSCWPPSATTAPACPAATSPPCSAPTTAPSPPPSSAITSLPGSGHPALAPGPVRVRTPTDLRRHAAAAGITIPDPPATRTPPQIAQ